MPTVSANGADLYHEVRGSGPPVLLIMGFTGDGGHFETLADLLADEFTVITYDRRGNGRSPRPAGWVRPPRRSRPTTRVRSSAIPSCLCSSSSVPFMLITAASKQLLDAACNL